MENLTHDEVESLEEEQSDSAPARFNIATPILLAFFLLLYVVMAYVSRGWEMPLKDFAMNPFGLDVLLKFGGLGSDALATGEVWRIITAAFVHVNLIHLAFNCWCVFSLGRAVESFYGTRRMFISYVACTMAANIAAVVMSSAPAIHIGTLGGLFGLDGVLLGFALRNRMLMTTNQFYRMVSGAIFWPVFWIVLAYTVFEGRGNIEGLVAGFAAGTLLGLAFEAVKFRPQAARPKPVPLVNLLFAIAVAVCVVSWAAHLRAEAGKGSTSAPGRGAPANRNTPTLDRELDSHVSEDGGFEILVPERMNVTEEDGKLKIGAEGWAFCTVTWRRAEGPEDPYELAWQVRSHLNREGFHPEGEITYPEVGGEQAAYLVMSREQGARMALYAQAALIHAGRVYTIIFQYLADDESARHTAGNILEEFRFTAGGRD